tara:strand:+ start:1077 stop:1361 length:285 start_codon:yes stop_codon:yes gene_type:complete
VQLQSQEQPAKIENKNNNNFFISVSIYTMEENKSTEKQFWKSKKWWAMAIAVSVPLANKILGLNLTLEELQLVIGPMVAYVMGQGIADIGKNKK